MEWSGGLMCCNRSNVCLHAGFSQAEATDVALWQQVKWARGDAKCSDR